MGELASCRLTPCSPLTVPCTAQPGGRIQEDTLRISCSLGEKTETNGGDGSMCGNNLIERGR